MNLNIKKICLKIESTKKILNKPKKGIFIEKIF
jgi:hypothetical protein